MTIHRYARTLVRLYADSEHYPDGVLKALREHFPGEDHEAALDRAAEEYVAEQAKLAEQLAQHGDAIASEHDTTKTMHRRKQ